MEIAPDRFSTVVNIIALHPVIYNDLTGFHDANFRHRSRIASQLNLQKSKKKVLTVRDYL
jgi:hypothetical protein